MPIIRLALILFFISLLVLLVAYFSTQNTRYLNAIKEISKYFGFLLLGAFLLYLIERIIRF